MKKATNNTVAESWGLGLPCRNNNGSFSTDGKTLWSYTTAIGFTNEKGMKVLLNYTAATGNFISMTTSSKHIAPAKSVADLIQDPSKK